MHSLSFKGRITDGIGRHSELYVPGRDEIRQAPEDWPVNLQKGSLNVRIFPDGYPPQFAERGLPNSTQTLDQQLIEPAFEIAQAEFGNNQLRQHPGMPHRGSAQVWRAVLTVNGQQHRCWVLRRYGSGLRDQLELVSDVHMRSAFGLMNGVAVEVVLGDG